MSEKAETPESGPEPKSHVAADPAATALALAGASRNEADAFLKDQRKLVELQARELAHELDLRHWSLWVRHISGLLKLAFEFSIALVLLAIVALLANEVWSAAHDEGLVIEAFSVPPDMAARGLTGQVIASQMLDQISALQATSNSVRAPGSYANNWGDDIKVEIPETGVSVGQIRTYLHQLLGHQTHITGEVVHTATGITITARVGTEAGKSFSGPEQNFDGLLQQAMLAVYASTQPYLYGVHLQVLGNIPEAEAFFTKALPMLPKTERVWADNGLFNILANQHRMVEATQAAEDSVKLIPDFAWGWSKVASGASDLGRAEEALKASDTALRLLSGSTISNLKPEGVSTIRFGMVSTKDRLLGDHTDTIQQYRSRYASLANSTDPVRQIQDVMSYSGANVASVVNTPASYAAELTASHDLMAAERFMVELPAFLVALRTFSDNRHDIRGQSNVDAAAYNFQVLDMSLASERQDWSRVVQTAPMLDTEDAKLIAAYASGGAYPPTIVWPARAYAEAKLGHIVAAHALIDKTPDDCDLCLRTRGKIDEAQKNYGGADFWFARAIAIAPSIPIAHADWGKALMQRGDLTGAIAQFKLANQKGPHFADPLEMWGEVLIAQNRSDLATSKFNEANKYAPNWGRLHLKWGEALSWLGKTAEAQKQFARAGELDLTAAEKSELLKVSGHV